jgi:hypothetical protein
MTNLEVNYSQFGSPVEGSFLEETPGNRSYSNKEDKQ